MKKITTLLIATALLGAACKNDTEKTVEDDLALGFDLSSLDSTVDPCTDFFQYAAGGWIEKNPIPETESRWGSFNILIEANNARVRGLLDSISTMEGLEKGSYQQMVADFYRTGMDSIAVEKTGITPLQSFLEAIEAVQSFDDYLALAASFEKRGVRMPWGTYVDVDDKNSNAHIMKMTQSGLGMPDRDYYLKSDSVSKYTQKEYRAHIAKMLMMSGYDAPKAQKAADDIYALEYKMAEKAMPRADAWDPDKTYNKKGAEAWMNEVPELKLQNFFTELNVSFDSLVVAQPDYLVFLNEQLPSVKVETLKDYARWHTLHHYADYLPQEWVQEDFNFYGTVLRGNKKMKPRWKRVLASIENGLDEPLGHLFADRYFPESAKKDIEKMVEDMRAVYGERIRQLDWMSDSTKEKALEKLRAFKYKIGYPDKWDDFEGLEIGAEGYLANAVQLDAYNVKENFEKLDEAVDKDEWFMPAHIVNAYYSPSFNEVVFPAGILQPPFYNINAEAAINYGGIGGVIGHEFTHGFDDNGSQYDAHGNLKNWWTDKDRMLFEERTGKMIRQYNAYEPLLETHVNGELTLGENIADLGGVTLAYYGYKKSLDEGRKDVVIDGFNWQQRIFLGWAQVWQTNQTDAYLRNQVVTDPHSPAKYRVNGPMSNMEEFKEAWGCNPNDEMVRPDSVRVVIW